GGRRQRQQPIRQEERGKRRHRESETEAAAHPAGGRGGGIAGRIGRKKSRAIGVSEFPYTIAPML
ncbi:hypothetical protein, partial [Paramuribaculum intestinale]|uniref:hypothetical protein n=1 Tax=Paramuribaculum intestinale TaxID=2094151 RepID=UPI0025B62E0D